ncbi:replication-relaxation family protein [Gimesia panareensis]|uniref:replication-relaxation family protein n=1 Tax=Gimesia panareensis TaxID=2527978 RepID=UPI00118BC072|nr:replication-relaxation family protein [Gimesia panareensis]QDU52964.1 hypothetical protein Pan110_53460 [Gimesia panareensis]
MRRAMKTALKLTERDTEILFYLDCHPLTVQQLFRLSQTFVAPFTQLRLLQRRLQKLTEAGYLQAWPYATTGVGTPHYFKLTRSGFQRLHGVQVELPRRRYFEAIAENHHGHTRALGEFLVHLLVTAHKQGVHVKNLVRENTLKIQAGDKALFPDSGFQLVTPAGKTFQYLVELDNSTERIRSNKAVESIESKLRGYDQHQGTFDSFEPDHYVVLFVTTRSSERLDHIMQAAKQVMANPRRTVFLGTHLPTFLACANPLDEVCLVDNRGRQRGLLPQTSSQDRPQRKQPEHQMAATLEV